MELTQIRDNPGAHRPRKIIGRGIGSGSGKTSGRGGKGQTARSGVRLKGFQGGQMPLSRRLPKVGFTNIFRLQYVEVNLHRIQSALDQGRLSKSQPVTAKALVSAGIFKNSRDGVRVLGVGTLNTALEFHVAGVSASAQKAIEAAGGKVVLLTSALPSSKSKIAREAASAEKASTFFSAP